jgi:hypothetical protein
MWAALRDRRPAPPPPADRRRHTTGDAQWGGGPGWR